MPLPLVLTPEIDAQCRAFKALADNSHPYPGGFSGRGIVICGGGLKFFPSAWVCIRMLREVGCILPIELWHLTEEEMTDGMRGLVKPYGVRCVNAQQMREQFPAKIDKGWPLKSYALMYSAFEEVLLLDADNMAIANPEFLFDLPQFKKQGTIFWPDQDEHTLSRHNPIWYLCGVPYRYEPAVESGQLLVNKKRSWHAMTLALYLNENSDLYYRHIYGDKDTFHMAWRRAKQDYAMPVRRYQWLERTMCQHDFDGNKLFQHRCLDKWRLHPRNAPDPGFLFEDRCFELLDELDQNWDICQFPVSRWNPKEREVREQSFAAKFGENRYWFERGDMYSRLMTFSRDGTVNEGSGDQERYWNLRQTEEGTFLDLSSVSEITCILQLTPEKNWIGHRLKDEVPIELGIVSAEQLHSRMMLTAS
jgi:hypothetical protein